MFLPRTLHDLEINTKNVMITGSAKIKEERNMMKMTSAYANKLLRQLDEDKDFYLNKEQNSCTYVAAMGEEPVIPDYDYEATEKEIEAIDVKIQKIKHAINLANVTRTVCVENAEYSIDVVLVRMAQLNRRKAMLDFMRKQLPKERQESHGYIANRSNVPEYKCINYDLDLIKKEYERISKEIMEMQIALDKHNQTYEFEVEI